MFVGHSVGDAHGIVIDMDEAVRDLLQRSRDEVIGVHYLDLTHPDDHARNTTGLDQLQFGGSPSLIRKRYVTPRGVAVPVDLRISRLATGMDEGRLVATIRRVDAERAAAGPKDMWLRARNLVQVAHDRKIALGIDLAGDYAWMILLQIYLAEVECRSLDPVQLCATIDFYPTVSTRWLKALMADGFVEAGREDGALQLTRSGFAAVEGVLQRG